MPQGVGYSFQPEQDQKKLLSGLNQGRLGPQANEALRILSLRLPQVLGGSPIAPADLLRPRVGGAVPGGAVRLQQTLGGGSPQGPPVPAPLLTGGGALGRGSLQVSNFAGPGSTPSPISAPAPDRGPVLGGAFTPPRPSITPGERDQSTFQPSQPGAAQQPGGDLAALLRLIGGALTRPGA